jgi:electron transport complex protein RnfG
MLCGLLIVSVFMLTGPAIERNRAQALERAVFKVLPGAVSKRSWSFDEAGKLRPATREDSAADTVHAGFDARGELVGVAVPGQGMGYQDIISVLFGYAPGTGTIIGLQVLASKETPGLGDKIEKDRAFLANFTALDVGLASDGRSLAHPVVAVKNGQKNAAWQVDGITGATISSQAIARILSTSGERWLPAIHAQHASMTAGGGQDDQP